MDDYSRLGLDIVPLHYTLLLEPEFITHTFKGKSKFKKEEKIFKEKVNTKIYFLS